MRALVKQGDGSVGLGERPPRTLEPGLVRVEVTATGVCGTDLHIAADEYASEPPVTMGHEISGRVVEVGSPSDAGWVGADVVCETYFTTCGTCDPCRDARRNLCRNRRSLGSFEDGGFAGSVVVPVVNLHRLPEGIDPLDAFLAEPLACVAQCLLDPAVVQPGDRVLVSGPGAVGLLAAQVARAGGGVVTVSGLPQDAQRLAVAASLGVATTTAPEQSAWDVVIECAGAAPAVVQAFRCAAPGGRVVQVGIVGRDVSLPYDLVLYRELVVSSGFASTARSWRRALALLEAGHVRFDGIVTHRLPLSQWEQAFALVGSPEAIKVAIIPD